LNPARSKPDPPNSPDIRLDPDLDPVHLYYSCDVIIIIINISISIPVIINECEYGGIMSTKTATTPYIN